MRNRAPRIALAVAALLWGIAAAATASAETAPDPRELGRQASDRFWRGEMDELWGRMTPQMRRLFGGADGFEEFHTQVIEQLGTPAALLEEVVESDRGVEVYRRVERSTRGSRAIVTSWGFDGRGRIALLSVQPQQVSPRPAESPHLDYRTRNRLRLPFDGEWFVYWGGRTMEQNSHVIAADQRFAYDFLVRVEGSSHRGKGERVEDYYCWDRPILAPADGKVVAAVGGLDDNPPGAMDPAHPPGNHVILELGAGEYALLAHLRKGSLTVAVGDRVTAGSELGRCGNSGNTSEPHLHFHLQNGPRFGRGLGLPAFFSDYLANGERVARGEPVRGQAVAPQDEPALDRQEVAKP